MSPEQKDDQLVFKRKGNVQKQLTLSYANYDLRTHFCPWCATVTLRFFHIGENIWKAVQCRVHIIEGKIFVYDIIAQPHHI